MNGRLVLVCVFLLLDDPEARLVQKHIALGQQKSALISKFPFYHTSAAISATIKDMHCAVPISVKTETCGPDCQIDIVDIGHEKVPHKAFYLFGEHARELISPETALEFVRTLCNPHNNYSTVLAYTQFRIIPNGNPSSRTLVEQDGKYCLRANERGVDLNRNWDAHWSGNAEANTDLDQLNPGPFPFSEAETRIFRTALIEFQPTLFATIHSGTRGMYMPWAWEAEAGSPRNSGKMKAVLSELDAKFCQCPAGQAAEEVGYNSPGTCLDWVHTNIPTVNYSFAFEIFTGMGQADLELRYQQQLRSSSFLQQESPLQEATCFEQFNPKSKDVYEETIKNWAQALIELAVMSHSK